MASPQRPEPLRPQRDPEGPAEATKKRKPGAPGGVPRWWWGFWIVIFALAIAWGIWGAVSNNGWWFVGHPRPSNVQGPPVSGTGMGVLQAASKQSFIGEHFDIHNVPVRRVVSAQVFWIGPENDSMLVVLPPPKSAKAFNGTTIVAGGLADVTGTVAKTPPRDQAQRQWSLRASDAARLEKQGAYIQATQAYWVPR